MKYVVGVCYIRRLCYGQKYTSWNWRHQSTGACIERRKWDLKRGQKRERAPQSTKKKASQCGRRKVYIFCTHCLFFYCSTQITKCARSKTYTYGVSFLIRTGTARANTLHPGAVHGGAPLPAGRLAECLVPHPKETHVFPHTNSSIVSGGDEFMTQIPF